jgi:hypothetical protein
MSAQPSHALPSEKIIRFDLDSDAFRKKFSSNDKLQKQLYAMYLGKYETTTLESQSHCVNFHNFCTLMMGKETSTGKHKKLLPEFVNAITKGIAQNEAESLFQAGMNHFLFQTSNEKSAASYKRDMTEKNPAPSEVQHANSVSTVSIFGRNTSRSKKPPIVHGTRKRGVLPNTEDADVASDILESLSLPERTLLHNVAEMCIHNDSIKGSDNLIPSTRRTYFTQIQALLKGDYKQDKVAEGLTDTIRAVIRNPMQYLFTLQSDKMFDNFIPPFPPNSVCTKIFANTPNMVEKMSALHGFETTKPHWEELMKHPEIAKAYDDMPSGKAMPFLRKYCDQYALAKWLQKPKHAEAFKAYLRGEAKEGNPFLDALGVPPHTLAPAKKSPTAQVEGGSAEVQSPEKHSRLKGMG